MIADDKLVGHAKAGDLSAFEELARKYQKQVFNIAYRFMGSREDAQDMAQEAFLKAFYNIKKFRGESSFKTWLLHILANVCRDELRKRVKKTEVSLDEPFLTDEGSYMVRQQANPSQLPEDALEQGEFRQYLQELINSLSVEYKLVIVMRDIQGFSYEEIASRLDCSLGTVKSRLSRARRALRDKLEKQGELFADFSRLSRQRGEIR